MDGECQMADEPCEVETGGGEVKTPQTASNEANLDSTQSTNSQEFESEKADPEGRRTKPIRGGSTVGSGCGQ